MQVAEMVGGRVAKTPKGLDIVFRTKTAAVRVDVMTDDTLILFGGPRKGFPVNFGTSVSRVVDLKRVADAHGYKAEAYFARGTSQRLLDKAAAWLGETNVHLFDE